jgi:hypothetical protein
LSQNYVTRLYTYWTIGVGVVLLYGGLPLTVEWHGTETLHTVMEALATMLAFLVGAMALVRYYTLKETVFLFIGAGYFGTGLLEGYHGPGVVGLNAAADALRPPDVDSLELDRLARLSPVLVQVEVGFVGELCIARVEAAVHSLIGAT